MSAVNDNNNFKRSEVTRAAWQRGILRWKLYEYQQPIYDSIINSTGLKFVLNCSRRFGKTTILCLISIETAIRTPNVQVRFAAPTAKALRRIILPIFNMLMEDCPDELRPKFNGTDNFFAFPNGSEIHLAGTDAGRADDLRGTASHLNIIDEAADIDGLDYVYKSVLLPQTLTTGGRTILASTPPKTPAHDFYNICIEAMAREEYVKFTIWDNKTLTKEQIDTYAKESGGYESTHFKREYECEFVVDEDSVIIPEWKDEYVKETPKDEYYQLYHKYVGMDLGVKDFTACVYAYYDFKRAVLVIEDETTMNGPSMTTLLLKDEIKAKEAELWGSSVKPYRRISDNNNLLLLQDLSSLHNLHFIPTNKDSLDAMVNELRLLVSAGKIEVNPKCKQVIGCLKYGIWNNSKNQRQFSRSAVYGHFDHLAALIYLVRNLDKHSNPIPHNHNMNFQNTFLVNESPVSTSIGAIKRLFIKPKINK